MRARLRASGSSDSVIMSRDAGAAPGDEAQPPIADSTTHASATQARPSLGSHLRAVDRVMVSVLLRTGRQGRHLFEHHGALLGDAYAHAGAVLHVAGQLATSGVDVVPSGFSHSRDDTSIAEHFREGEHLFVGRTRQSGLGEWIEGDEIDLARYAAAAVVLQQVDELARMLALVVHPFEHAVFESDEVARRVLQVAIAGVQQVREAVLAVQWHQVVAQ